MENIQEIVHALRDAPFANPRMLAKVGEQMPLFIGPCLYCKKGYVSHLPQACPNCGKYLSQFVTVPRTHTSLWIICHKIRVWLCEHIPNMFQMFYNRV